MSLRHNAIVACAETNVMKKSDRDVWVVFESKHCPGPVPRQPLRADYVVDLWPSAPRPCC
jgi:hypothetical protein